MGYDRQNLPFVYLANLSMACKALWMHLGPKVDKKGKILRECFRRIKSTQTPSWSYDYNGIGIALLLILKGKLAAGSITIASFSTDKWWGEQSGSSDWRARIGGIDDGSALRRIVDKTPRISVAEGPEVVGKVLRSDNEAAMSILLPMLAGLEGLCIDTPSALLLHGVVHQPAT